VTQATTRPAIAADAPRLAQLHVDRINEGFLAHLGPAFLSRLYRRMIRSPRAFVVVAEAANIDAEDRGEVVAFCAAAEDVKRFYIEFIVRDGAVAGLRSAPRVVRAMPRVMETLRYPTTTGDLPQAEILAVVVDAKVAGQGLGSAVLGEALSELRRRGCESAKVVAGASNDTALRMYRRCGFDPHGQISIHDEVPSEVLVWAPS
jgi:ribosomal protein S18 acetylase RimI-like enzyme